MSSREESYLDRFNTRRVVRRSRGSRKPTIDDLKRYLQEATAAKRTSPDLALNMEIADLVNQLKGDAPNVVCKHVTSYTKILSFPPSAMNALSVLDACVKNCGYAFHLAISRKEFLNKLVASFSYRPPRELTSVQLLILEMIEEWNLTIARSAVYRDDLGNIRDMRRLLASRGYMFPEINNSELLALSSDQNSLKSAAELEREEHERQSVKMGMLLGSKNPEDLKEANRLMSILAGFQEPQVDYRAKVAADLDKLRRTKELLLSAISSGVEPGSSNDVFEELAQTLKSAIPKLEKLLEGEASEEEDPEAHGKVTELLTSIETALAQYKSAVTGEPVNLPASRTGTKATDSLIDIGDDSSAPSNDLLALSLGPGSSSATTANSNVSQPSSSLLGDFSSPAPPSKPTESKSDDLLDIFGSSSTSTQPSANISSLASAPSNTVSQDPVTEIWSDDSLKVSFAAKKSGSTTEITLKFTNAGIKKITGLETQIAQPRTLSMELGALSSTQLEPHQDAVQRVKLSGDTAPKLRWRANYNFGLDKRSANGDIKNV